MSFYITYLCSLVYGTKMDFTKVKNFVDTLEGIGIPGCDLSIYLEDKEVYRYYTGVGNLESQTPITPDSLYPIWSMTKVITCVAALRLFEEGRYLLNDPLYEYMSEFKNLTIRHTRENGDVVELPATKPIRIRDLFTMSTGYSYDALGAHEFFQVPNEGNVTLREMVLTLAKMPIRFEPGTRWCYGYSHDILGALIEVLSGKTLGEYFAENIFNPLGMYDTSFKVPKDKQHRLVSCYTYDEETKNHSYANLGIAYFNKSSKLYFSDDWIHENAGGGLISTVNDYAKFARSLCMGGTLVNNYHILGEATINLMRTNFLNNVQMNDYSGEWAHHNSYGYGLGVRTMVNPTHGGVSSNYGEFGWSGLPGLYVLMDPAAKLTYVYAQQLFPSKEEFVAPRLKTVIYGCL